MDGLDPVVDWLNNSSTEWVDAPMPCLDEGTYDSDPFQDVGFAPCSDDWCFDWDPTLDPGLEVVPRPADQNAEATLGREVEQFVIARKHADEQTTLTVLRLRSRVETLESTLQLYEGLEARTRELEQRASENLKFSAEMSYVVNDIQLRQQGLSPLQKRFNVVLGAKLGKRS